MTKPESHSVTHEMQSESHLSEPKSGIRKKSHSFGVSASPFNGIKIELGFAIIFGAILWLAADSITANEGTQWLLLLGYGLVSMFWLVLRTRAVLRQCLAGGQKNS